MYVLEQDTNSIVKDDSIRHRRYLVSGLVEICISDPFQGLLDVGWERQALKWVRRPSDGVNVVDGELHCGCWWSEMFTSCHVERCVESDV